MDASDGGAILPFPGWASAAGTAGALAGDVPSLARWGHELLGGDILRDGSLREMARFQPSGPWDGDGLGLARDSIDGHTMWGHGGDGLGSHSELWHLPHEQLTVAISWNDGMIDQQAGILLLLLRTALGSS